MLILLGTTAVGLAASPTAFAHERGGPGAPSAHQLTRGSFLPVCKSSQRFVSWSD